MTSQPAATPTPLTQGQPSGAQLRNQIAGLEQNVAELTARKAELTGQRDATNRPGEHARLNGQLRAVDGQIDAAKTQLAGLRARLKATEAGLQTTPPAPALPVPVTPAAPLAPPAPPFQGTTVLSPRDALGRYEMLLGGAVTVFVLAPIAFAIAWRLIRRSAPPPVSPTISDQRLERIEHAVDTIAIEMERVMENQRFLTKALAEGKGAEGKSVDGAPIENRARQ